jgi:hypothetical protein
VNEAIGFNAETATVSCNRYKTVTVAQKKASLLWLAFS